MVPIEKNICFIKVDNLIKLYIFQEQLKLQLKKGKGKGKKNLILIDRKWLNNLKDKYSYNALCDYIKNIGIIKDKIKNLENYENILNEIIENKKLNENLINNKTNKINEIDKKEKTQKEKPKNIFINKKKYRFKTIESFFSPK